MSNTSKPILSGTPDFQSPDCAERFLNSTDKIAISAHELIQLIESGLELGQETDISALVRRLLHDRHAA